MKLNCLKWEGWEGRAEFTRPPKPFICLYSSLESLASVTNTGLISESCPTLRQHLMYKANVHFILGFCILQLGIFRFLLLRGCLFEIWSQWTTHHQACRTALDFTETVTCKYYYANYLFKNTSWLCHPTFCIIKILRHPKVSRFSKCVSFRLTSAFQILPFFMQIILFFFKNQLWNIGNGG